MHCCGFGRYYRTQKAEESLKKMNALLILKTTRSSNVGRIVTCHTELEFQKEKKKNVQLN
jgi:hypothetical protein